MGRRLCAALLFALISGALLAADLHVPSEFGTMQAAIDAAEDGDRILVEAGSYLESLTISGKRLTLECASTEGTVGNRGEFFNGAPVIAVSSGADVTLRRFHVSGQLGEARRVPIHCESSSLTLIDCTVVGPGGASGRGGREGVICVDAPSVHITDSVISGGKGGSYSTQMLDTIPGQAGWPALRLERCGDVLIERSELVGGDGGPTRIGIYPAKSSPGGDGIHCTGPTLLTLIESRSVGGKGADANHNPGPPITAGDGGNGVFATSFTAVAACASTLEAGVEGAGEPAGTPGEALALAGGSTFSPGDCLQVPDSFGTIQAAIDAAVDGDLILIAPGTYEEAPIVVGKRLTLASQEGGERPMIQSSGIALVVTGEADVTLRFLELHGADAPDAPLGEDAEAGSAALVAANSAITLVNTWLWGGDGGLGGDEFSLGRRGGDGGPGAVIADAPEVTLELAYLFGGDGGRGGPGIDGGVGGDGGVGLSLANTSMFDASLSTCEGGVGGAAGVSIDTPPIAGGGGRGGDALRASAVQGRAETFWMLGGAGGNFFVAGAGVGGDSLVATEGTRLCAYELYGEPGPGGQGMSSVTGPTGEALILSEDSTIALPPQVVAQLVISPQPMGTYHSSTQRAASDANRDGAVDAADVVQMVALWDACEEP